MSYMDKAGMMPEEQQGNMPSLPSASAPNTIYAPSPPQTSTMPAPASVGNPMGEPQKPPNQTLEALQKSNLGGTIGDALSGKNRQGGGQIVGGAIHPSNGQQMGQPNYSNVNNLTLRRLLESRQRMS